MRSSAARVLRMISIRDPLRRYVVTENAAADAAVSIGGVGAQSDIRGLRTSLVALALASFLPVLAFAGVVVYLFMEQYRHEVQERLVGVAQAISTAVDRELAHQINMVENMARPGLLDRANLSVFHAALRELQVQEGWLGVALHDPANGRQILNSAAPLGAVLPDAMDPTTLREVAGEVRPRVVGIQPRGTVLPEPFILLRVPVVREGKVPLVLSAAVPPEALNTIVAKQRLPLDSVVAVLDSRMHIAARNRAPAEFVGTRATPSLTDNVEAAEYGLFLALNKEGQAVYTVFHKSVQTNWAVAIGIPAAIIDGPLHRTMLIIGAIGVVLVASGVAFAAFIGRTIARRRRAEAELERARVELAARERKALIVSKEAAERDSQAKSKSLKAAEEQLHQAQKLEAVGQLTGGVAHDFNNLLQVILGNAELLAETLSGHPKLQKLAEMTTVAAERGAELTNRLLAFARRQALDPKATDVNKLLAGMEGLLRRSLGEHIEIEIVRSAGLWTAMIDASQLESAILNLCINARDAMPEGGQLTIETANAHLDQDYVGMHTDVSAGQYVMVAVSDTGTGMPPEVISRAFDPFFTTKAVGKGSGLGLSMVYGFVKQSQGHVKIYSELGEGTTVKLYMPRANSGSADVESRASIADVPGGSERILLVEDDELVRVHVAAQLEGLGYQVVSARNGPEALEELETAGDIDLLFTDMVMPGGMSGRQLADEVRRRRPGLPVLFTSGYTENAIVHNGRLDEGVHLLPKPYRRQNLAAKLRQVFASHGRN